MIERGQNPKKGLWALPAGFIEADESIEEAAIRECKEETNLDIELIEMFHVDSFPTDPTPQSGIIIFYRAKPLTKNLQPGDDAAKAKIFSPTALPANVAFRTHRAALKRWAGLHGAVTSFTTSKQEAYPIAPDLLIRRSRSDDESSILRLLKLIPANKDLTRSEVHAAKVRFRESTSLDILVAENQGEFVSISVRDSGIGIPKEHMKRLFTKFYRVPGSEQHAQGTGLGLSIVKRIIEGHGGEINVESVQGEGTTFKISLPTMHI